MRNSSMMPENRRALLLEVARKRSPESLRIAEAFLSGSQLARPELDMLIDLISAEFLREGLRPDDEPTQLGLELEALLDDVNRRRLS